MLDYTEAYTHSLSCQGQPMHTPGKGGSTEKEKKHSFTRKEK